MKEIDEIIDHIDQLPLKMMEDDINHLLKEKLSKDYASLWTCWYRKTVFSERCQQMLIEFK